MEGVCLALAKTEAFRLNVERNSILRHLPSSDYIYLRPFLERVSHKQRASLQEPRRPIEYVSFIETGIASLRTLASGSLIETALVGCQGAVGVSAVLGARTPIHQCIMLVPGTAIRIGVDDFRHAMCERPQIRDHILKYVQALMIHCSQTALCGVHHNTEARLASWICLACDSLDSDTLPITHDNLSVILGLRRAGVTESLTRFENHGLVRKMRGVLEVCDRGRLRERACACCGVIAGAYRYYDLD
jgi:CRP-like cAMP-binding protein